MGLISTNRGIFNTLKIYEFHIKFWVVVFSHSEYIKDCSSFLHWDLYLRVKDIP